MRNAIVVFTKVPRAGDIKTRLTTERGGILTMEEACDFYEAALLDVIDACLASGCGDVWICHNHDGDRDYMEQLLAGLSDRKALKGIYTDQGGSFDDCIQYAADYILKDGGEERLADYILIIGGDLPGLQPGAIKQAFKKIEVLSSLEQGQAVARKIEGSAASIGAAIVEGSCQEGGFSIVGFTCTTPFDFHSVFYNQEGVTALDRLVDKTAEITVPFGIIEMVPDVDIPIDLASVIPQIRAIQLAAQSDPEVLPPRRTIKFFEDTGLQTSTPVGARYMV